MFNTFMILFPARRMANEIGDASCLDARTIAKSMPPNLHVPKLRPLVRI
jgi:hypothetical protein